MIDDKDVNIHVYSRNEGHTLQVLGEVQVFFSKDWSSEDFLGFGEENFVELLNFLGYKVYHEETY